MFESVLHRWWEGGGGGFLRHNPTLQKPLISKQMMVKSVVQLRFVLRQRSPLKQDREFFRVLKDGSF